MDFLFFYCLHVNNVMQSVNVAKYLSWWRQWFHFSAFPVQSFAFVFISRAFLNFTLLDELRCIYHGIEDSISALFLILCSSCRLGIQQILNGRRITATFQLNCINLQSHVYPFQAQTINYNKAWLLITDHRQRLMFLSKCQTDITIV